MKPRFLTMAICTFALFSVDLTYGHYPVSPYAYANNNPVRFVDPDGRDWYSYDEEYEDKEGNKKTRTLYQYTTEYRSQKDLDEAGIKGTYIGLNETVNDTYLSLFGQKFTTGSKEEQQIAKMAQNLDETIKNYYKNDIIDYGYGIMEQMFYSHDMVVPGATVGKTTVFSYGEGTVRYRIAENMSRGVFTWGSGIYSNLNYFKPQMPGYHAYVERQNAEYHPLHWTFPNAQAYNATKQQANRLFKDRKGYK